MTVNEEACLKVHGYGPSAEETRFILEPHARDPCYQWFKVVGPRDGLREQFLLSEAGLNVVGRWFLERKWKVEAFRLEQVAQARQAARRREERRVADEWYAPSLWEMAMSHARNESQSTDGT